MPKLVEPVKEFVRFQGSHSMARVWARQQIDGSISTSTRNPSPKDIKRLFAWLKRANAVRPALRRRYGKALKKCNVGTGENLTRG